jgi:3-oxoacyl-(acyl-carrier-protein) synthase
MAVRRVVITGVGVVAPNARGLGAFSYALREKLSGIEFQPHLRDLGFACQVAGVPRVEEQVLASSFSQDDLRAMNSCMRFGALAALEAWQSAALPLPDRAHRDPHTGAIIGSGMAGADTFAEHLVPKVNAKAVRRLGSAIVEQAMNSSVSAKVGGLLGLGNQVSSNSSACSTGLEAILLGLTRIRNGLAERMLVGGSEGCSHYIWAGFDAMRVLSRHFNEDPTRASRPLSQSAGGFVPAGGSAVLILESLESARARGAPILAEVLGGYINCGGQRGGGSMTAPNPEAVRDCIKRALADARVDPNSIDAISGHLTGTFADPQEIESWCAALECRPEAMPLVNSTKSLIGHTLGAAGAIESAAVVCQLRDGFVHASVNCDDLHDRLKSIAGRIPHDTVCPERLRIIAKASFGFGDVNACALFQRWDA